MRFAIITMAALAAAFTGPAAVEDASAQALAIGIAAPLSGPSALLGEQVEAGADLAARANDVALTVADDACSADGGAQAAGKFVAAKVRVVVGFLCTEAIDAALPILKDAGIPVIALGTRTDSLTDQRARTGWPIVRLGPRDDDERNAAADILPRLWKDELFAIVDDGTIYGRELAEQVRAAAGQAALKPVFVDTFRPELDNQIGLVGRLAKAGATHVFVGGDGSDIAIMARDAQKLGLGMVFAGGEALRAAPGDVPHTAGTLMIAPPEWADIADKSVLDAFAEANVQPDGYALPAFASVQIARAADEAAGKSLLDSLQGREFATAIGPVRFNEKGDMAQNPDRLFRFDGVRFVPVETN